MLQYPFKSRASPTENSPMEVELVVVIPFQIKGFANSIRRLMRSVVVVIPFQIKGFANIMETTITIPAVVIPFQIKGFANRHSFIISLARL